MASLGKLTNAFLQASQETTFTLANLNFNFALIKYEAPEEYRGLGESLSTQRKLAAEDGSVHITARKLAALFQSVIPPVPNLIQAYGVRVSEIAAMPDVNPRGNARQGIFAEHVGADGTSIWASATSGKDAVTIHLLACMLARIWKREEAIPIWTELVEQRKALLHNSIARTDGPFQVSDLAASRIELSRTELDEWDSSARAWLQTADTGQRLRQTQLRLIFDNISLPVSVVKNIYSATMDAWTSAMETLESLIKGEPQQIDNGAILLGLSAWHLYPNIFVVSNNRHVYQSDPLVSPGGIITVGLQNKSMDGKGVVWSLPLSQARYYGEPVTATRHAGVGNSQVSFQESMLVVVGSVLSSWELPEANIDDAMDLIRIIAGAAKSRDVSSPPDGNSLLPEMPNPLRAVSGPFMRGHDWVEWLILLASSIEYYRKADGTDKENLTRLIKYGQRNCSKLLSSRKARPLPVFGLTGFSPLLESFEEEDEKNHEAMVVFLRKWAIRELSPEVVANATIRYRLSPIDMNYYAKITDQYAPPSKRQRLGSSSSQRAGDGNGLRWTEFDKDDLVVHVTETYDHVVFLPPGPGRKAVSHKFLCGDSSLAAIYVRSSSFPEGLKIDNHMNPMQLYKCIKEGDIDEKHVAKSLVAVKNSSILSTAHTYFESLWAIAASSKIYARLPGAWVDLQAMSSPVSKAKWWQSMRGIQRGKLQAVMSCIAYFEAGGLNVDPDDLGAHTFAVCHATSIFVASRLLGDPIDETIEYSVERIIGNVGKPGLSFLITPPGPKRQHFDPSSWHLIAHAKYDGKVQDNFQGTSFHLSFTGYRHPLTVGQRSRRDIPAYLLETAVSVHDKGKWVADLDILKASKHWKKALPSSCAHHPGTQSPVPELPLISVDSWLEILDPPREGQHAVVRANGNPTARLATAALASQKGHEVLILPEKVCWECQGWSLISNTELESPSENTGSDVVSDFDFDGFLEDSDSEDNDVICDAGVGSGDPRPEYADNGIVDVEPDSDQEADIRETGLFIIY